MAECIESASTSIPDWIKFSQNLNDQIDEINALNSFYENTDCMEIFNEASNENSSKFILQLKVPVQSKKKPLKIELWLPIDELNMNKIKINENDCVDDKKPVLRRSLSGKRAQTVLNCDYVPSIDLNITLPDTYPSQSAPLFKLSSYWLSNYQLNLLCTKLDEIWAENLNMPILFTWFNWLEENSIDFLDIFEEPNKILITPLNDYDSENALIHNSRVECLFDNSDNFIYEFLRYNFIHEIKEFNNSIQNCMICFDEKLGKEFFRLDTCKHHFCVDCVTLLCQMHVKEGTIQLLKCPDKNCKETIPVNVMSQVLKEEDFDRWERLLFQNTLDKMEDVIYCPKCSNPIIVDNYDTHAFCMICKIDFCKLCKDTWHTDECKSEDVKINQKINKLGLTMADLTQLSDDELKKKFKGEANFIRVIKLKELTANMTQNDETFKLMKKFKVCPICRIPIEKIDGCNKVTCKCGCILCYICGSKINGYDHFDSGCNLWSTNNIAQRVVERPIHEAQVVVQRVLNLMPDQRRNIMNCPNCRQQQLKLDNNNHLKCWLCKTNMCFYCKKKFIGLVSNHFGPNKCKQHSEKN